MSTVPAETKVTAQAAIDMWAVFMKHDLTYPQAIHVMAATTKMIGRKSGNREVEAGLLMVDDLIKIIPAILPEIS
jgi:hypothetical protein